MPCAVTNHRKFTGKKHFKSTINENMDIDMYKNVITNLKTFPLIL